MAAKGPNPADNQCVRNIARIVIALCGLLVGVVYLLWHSDSVEYHSSAYMQECNVSDSDVWIETRAPRFLREWSYQRHVLGRFTGVSRYKCN